MPERLRALEREDLAHLRAPCRDCGSWQRGLVEPSSVAVPRDLLAARQRWFDEVDPEHGPLGWVALSEEGEVRGQVMYAPAAFVPRSGAFPTSPISADAVLLLALTAGSEAGCKRLLRRAVKDLRRRRVPAVEAFAGPPGVAGCATRPASGSVPCRLPRDLLERWGFYVVREHPVSPRVRLDVGAAVPVRAIVGEGLEGLRSVAARRRPEPGLGRTAREE